ncbi:MAG: M28 family metallopeptidase [Acidobacteriia bacterium]|nr:M28 family metallopeptidase [Terriglobia bacterium]
MPSLISCRTANSRRPALFLLAAAALLLAGRGTQLRGQEQPAAPPAAAKASIRGFTPQHAQLERQLETQFQSIPSPEKARAWHRELTAEPHPAASARNNQLADYIAEEWRKQGWEEVVLRRYDVLHSRPRSVSLEMVAPMNYKAGLREDAYPADPDTKNPAVSGAYFGYSASGEVTAEVVYAHSGNPEDYDLLRKNGISVKGKIVLVRYSNPYSYRGFKALTAEREGAAALLIYSDPAEDGYTRGKVFPDGPWGPESHIQRGAITYDYIVPGDPLTPGWPSLPGAKRIPISEARSLPKIMALPLSWRDAQPLLANMTGAEAPKEWQGALPITYRFTGSVKAHVKVDMDTSIQPYTVVEARIKGSELPDEWVLLGNHRDAWAFGGVDPSSGTASLLELTRSLGELKKRGQRPRRTIVVCSWDGEEYALTGSTEWGEQFADHLRKNLVAYLNVDESVSGAAATAGPDGLSFKPDAVGSLAPMIVEASHDVRMPSGRSLYDSWRATRMRDDKSSSLPDDSSLVETRIGSGSDHTVFLNHLGRPVANLTFSGDYGVYHSQYDDHFWMARIGDPAFEYHIALTRIWGLLALRLANADVLPFDFAFYGQTLAQFLDELAQHSRVPASLDLQPLRARLAEFQRVGGELNASLHKALAAGALEEGLVPDINDRFLRVESNWLNEDGIPGRPWFKHLLYAARYTYAHLEYPGLTEAVEQGDWKTAQEQLSLLEKAVEKNTELLRVARTELDEMEALTPHEKPSR